MMPLLFALSACRGADTTEIDDRLAALEDDVADLQASDAAAMAARIDALEEELATLRAAADGRDALLAAHDADLDVLDADVAAIDTDLAALDAQVSVHAQALSVLQSDGATNAAALAALDTDLAAAELGLTALGARLDTIEADYYTSADGVLTTADLVSPYATFAALQAQVSANRSGVTTHTATLATITADHLTSADVADVLRTGDVDVAFGTFDALQQALSDTIDAVTDLEGGTVTPQDLADALAPYALNSTLDDYPTELELATALLDHPTHGDVSAALGDYVPTTALADYPTESELADLLADLVDEDALAAALTGYAPTSALDDRPTDTELTAILAGYVTDGALGAALGGYTTPADVARILDDGSYATLDDVQGILDDGGYMTDAEVVARLTGVVPPGTIVPFAGATVPAGWAYCNGATVSSATYPGLYAAIGNAWGAGGDGAGPLFHLPDLRGRFVRGVGHGTGRDPDAGARFASATGGNTGDAVGTLQDDALYSHRHTMGVNGTDTFSMAPGGATQRLAHFVNDGFGGGGAKVTDFTGGNETRPRNAAVYYLIKL